MAMTADRSGYGHEFVLEETFLPVAAGAVIYLGAMVSKDATGYAEPALLVGQDNKVIYYALCAADATGLLDGEIRVRCMKRGTAFLPVASLTIANTALPVYATDDETLTSVSNVRPVGTLDRVDGDKAVVRFG